LALALALAVPSTVAERSQIIVSAFAVVAFSILVQGLTMPMLIKRFGFGGKEQEDGVAAPAAAS
jgi:CPA1 family monovalent cation:H+ antiporter